MKNNNWVWKEKNVTINKIFLLPFLKSHQAVKVLYFRREILKKFEKYEGLFEYRGKTKKSIKLSVSIKKEIPKIDKDGYEFYW